MRLRKTIVGLSAAAILAVPATAMAAAPDGSYTIAPKANENASLVGQQSSQITQNGQFISGKYLGATADWQNQKGDRSATVQDLLGH